MEESNLEITIEVFASEDADDGLNYWELESITVTECRHGLPVASAAARSAASAAAWSAAWSAAMAAEWSSDRAAKWSAGWDAGWAAGWAAARSAQIQIAKSL